MCRAPVVVDRRGLRYGRDGKHLARAKVAQACVNGRRLLVGQVAPGRGLKLALVAAVQARLAAQVGLEVHHVSANVRHGRAANQADLGTALARVSHGKRRQRVAQGAARQGEAFVVSALVPARARKHDALGVAIKAHNILCPSRFRVSVGVFYQAIQGQTS